MFNVTDKADNSSGRRGRKPSPEAVRKDRIIQTRVPKDLESTLKDAAERERVSVSQLIRHVLEDTFTLVDGIVADSASLIDHVARDARHLAESAKGLTPKKGEDGEKASKANTANADSTSTDKPAATNRQALDAVEAWQDVIVNKPGQCNQCGVALKRGEKAFRGVSSIAGAPAAWLCGNCIKKL